MLGVTKNAGRIGLPPCWEITGLAQMPLVHATTVALTCGIDALAGHCPIEKALHDELEVSDRLPLDVTFETEYSFAP